MKTPQRCCGVSWVMSLFRPHSEYSIVLPGQILTGIPEVAPGLLQFFSRVGGGRVQRSLIHTFLMESGNNLPFSIFFESLKLKGVFRQIKRAHCAH